MEGDPPSEEFVIIKEQDGDEPEFKIVYNIERIPADEDTYQIPTGKHYIRVTGWDTQQSNIARTEVRNDFKFSLPIFKAHSFKQKCSIYGN